MFIKYTAHKIMQYVVDLFVKYHFLERSKLKAKNNLGLENISKSFFLGKIIVLEVAIQLDIYL